eukprot:3609879-Pleurochrysis_carterae.AAC.2
MRARAFMRGRIHARRRRATDRQAEGDGEGDTMGKERGESETETEREGERERESGSARATRETARDSESEERGASESEEQARARRERGRGESERERERERGERARERERQRGREAERAREMHAAGHSRRKDLPPPSSSKACTFISCTAASACSQLLLKGELSAVEAESMVVDFVRAFGRDAAVYYGGPDAQAEGGTLVHGFAELEGAQEIASGAALCATFTFFLFRFHNLFARVHPLLQRLWSSEVGPRSLLNLSH